MSKFETTFNPSGIIGVNGSKEACVIAFPDKVIGSEGTNQLQEGLLRIVKIDVGTGIIN